MTKELQKAVENFTEVNLSKKGLYHYNDMQDAFILGFMAAEKCGGVFEGKVIMDFSDPADVVCRRLIVDKKALDEALLKLDIGDAKPDGMPVIVSVRKKENQ